MKKIRGDELLLALIVIFFPPELSLFSVSKQNKRIFYTILELSPLLDSSNMTPEDWAKIAKKLEVLWYGIKPQLLLKQK